MGAHNRLWKNSRISRCALAAAVASLSAGRPAWHWSRVRGSKSYGPRRVKLTYAQREKQWPHWPGPRHEPFHHLARCMSQTIILPPWPGCKHSTSLPPIDMCPSAIRLGNLGLYLVSSVQTSFAKGLQKTLTEWTCSAGESAAGGSKF